MKILSYHTHNHFKAFDYSHLKIKEHIKFSIINQYILFSISFSSMVDYGGKSQMAHCQGHQT